MSAHIAHVSIPVGTALTHSALCAGQAVPQYWSNVESDIFSLVGQYCACSTSVLHKAKATTAAVKDAKLTVAVECRTAVHCSLFALYGLGGFLVQRKLLPIRVLLSAIGFTFSLVFATQGVVQTLADTRRVTSSIQR